MGFAYLIGDLNSLSVYDEVKFTKVSWTPTLGAPGKLTVSLPATDPHVAQIVEWRTVVYVTDTTKVRCAGVVVNTKWAAGLYTYECLLLSGYLDRRTYRTDHTWTATDQFTIVSDLVTAVEASSLGVGLTFRGHPASTSGVTRTLVVKGSERKQVGKLISDLAVMDSGFDWDVTCEWDPTIPNKILRYFDVWYPGRGRALELVWEHGRAAAITGATRTGTGIADLFDEVGDNSGGTPTIATVTVTRATGRPRLESVETLSDQTASALLTAKATANAARNAEAVWALEVTLTGEGDTDPDRWEIGDSVTFVARAEGVPEIEARHRIVAATYTVGVTDALVVSGVQLSPLLFGDPVRPPNFFAETAKVAQAVRRLERR